ncbi:MAG: hypothetical protein C0592_07575 [Marinilabiliales bacterium]|nr:MAG: hypothetical protein C0592_07575 [Marinilabiliales bacterium]
MNTIKIISILILLFVFGSLHAQESEPMQLSLAQACEYAKQNNTNVQNAQIDVEIARKKVWETTAIGLPQINGSVEYQNFLDIPTTLLPDFISPSVYGVLLQEGLITPAQMPSSESQQFFPAKFGTQHNASYGVTLSQLIFSGQYIVGLQAARVFSMVSQQSLQKNEIDVVASVTETYCLVLSLQENKNSLDSNLASFQKLLFETEALYKEGFVEEINVDQLTLNVSSLQNGVNSIARSIEAAKMLLAFQMGMPVSQKLELTDDLESIVSTIDLEQILSEDYDPAQSIDYQIMETQVRLMELDMKREKTAYLPTLAGFFSYSEKAMRDEFNFFDGDQDWFPTTLVGFQLEIPLWSSGSRHSKVQQAKLKVQKSENTRDMVGESLKLQYTQARIEYLNAVDTYVTEKENMLLSKKILDKTIIKYREGITGSTELTQIQMQYQTAQANYFAAMFRVISAKTKLNKLLVN